MQSLVRKFHRGLSLLAYTVEAIKQLVDKAGFFKVVAEVIITIVRKSTAAVY